MPDFSFTISADQLARGLRPSKRVPRDAKYLVESKGAVGKDGVLAALQELERFSTSDITDAFPFPQAFVFTNFVIVCSSNKIYEWDGSSLNLKLTTTRGSTWSAVDFFNFVYMSNGVVAVTRSATTGEYSVVTDVPTANAILNFNGQVIIGSPDCGAVGASLTMDSENLGIALSIYGDISLEE
ncbi:hypothetical protein KO465_04715 [Candidatus Micrarchaeota archaeon]|jgi:hypothetical protein|nr:hypothetical protein [Candidatus Micrarchaeota archaeon]